MVAIKTNLSDNMLKELEQLAKENHRNLSQEISYRLDQAIHYKTHLSDEEIGLFKIISKLHDDELDEINFKESTH